jgi:hypothetical protein
MKIKTATILRLAKKWEKSSIEYFEFFNTFVLHLIIGMGNFPHWKDQNQNISL